MTLLSFKRCGVDDYRLTIFRRRPDGAIERVGSIEAPCGMALDAATEALLTWAAVDELDAAPCSSR